MLNIHEIRRYIGVVVLLAAIEIVVLAVMMAGIWRLADGMENTNTVLLGPVGVSGGCCILRCENAGEPAADVRYPTVTPTPAACQVDTATPGVASTDTPDQPTPQATPTSTALPEPEPTATSVATSSPVPSSTPNPDPAATNEPDPTAKPKCNHGGGNGSEGCDPGRDPTQANNDGDHTPEP
ncbi:hypothetical protein LCGC14_0491070 [marine sediment metagenome]|uniref:Uncharacterized protein n=1 Tax=marine sediment metagenome TaxID=412755 RepID=A0A0F9SBR8_9ZZZZ